VPQHSLPRRIAVVLAIAATVVQISSAHALAPAAAAGSAFFSSAPGFALPWAEGQTWRLTGGPHADTGRGRPWSSLDFAGPLAGGAYRVAAVAGGTVNRPCPNMVEIRHGNGWRTSYYHLTDIRVRDGQKVQRGQVLGLTSTRAGCGGYATGAHVHFTVLYRGDPVNVRGLRIGGWTVREGDEQYVGCLVRDGTRRCSPGGKVRNFGV
jgi:LasA protease